MLLIKKINTKDLGVLDCKYEGFKDLSGVVIASPQQICIADCLQLPV